MARMWSCCATRKTECILRGFRYSLDFRNSRCRSNSPLVLNSSLSPQAVHADGRIATTVLRKDSWWDEPAILDPKTGQVEAHRSVRRRRVPDWLDAGWQDGCCRSTDARVLVALPAEPARNVSCRSCISAPSLSAFEVEPQKESAHNRHARPAVLRVWQVFAFMAIRSALTRMRPPVVGLRTTSGLFFRKRCTIDSSCPRSRLAIGQIAIRQPAVGENLVEIRDHVRKIAAHRDRHVEEASQEQGLVARRESCPGRNAPPDRITKITSTGRIERNLDLRIAEKTEHDPKTPARGQQEAFADQNLWYTPIPNIKTKPDTSNTCIPSGSFSAYAIQKRMENHPIARVRFLVLRPEGRDCPCSSRWSCYSSTGRTLERRHREGESARPAVPGSVAARGTSGSGRYTGARCPDPVERKA